MQITKNQIQRENLKGDQNKSHFTYRRARIRIKINFSLETVTMKWYS